MQYENLSKLLDIVKEKLHGFDYFHAKLEFNSDSKDRINPQTT